ncbi:hypothetical protein ANCCAN_15742 [Ancylostoma caninum]|uniref:Uncharacterized protein n=1 Tax=Ancylostoma caninum TaxID=29170 RepID=A0A368G1K1_ANCCA|nr:hypothetical protein ANCCAN_15742 [Ancylostoma caninum]
MDYFARNAMSANDLIYLNSPPSRRDVRSYGYDHQKQEWKPSSAGFQRKSKRASVPGQDKENEGPSK